MNETLLVTIAACSLLVVVAPVTVALVLSLGLLLMHLGLWALLRARPRPEPIFAEAIMAASAFVLMIGVSLAI